MYAARYAFPWHGTPHVRGQVLDPQPDDLQGTRLIGSGHAAVVTAPPATAPLAATAPAGGVAPPAPSEATSPEPPEATVPAPSPLNACEDCGRDDFKSAQALKVHRGRSHKE